jgi:hypothetical protein
MIRRFLRIFAALAGLLAGPLHLQAADATQQLTVFERAEFVLAKRITPPTDAAGWEPAALPDDWRRLGAEFRGQGWYRMLFDLPAIPERPLGLYLRHGRSRNVEFFVNGALLGSTEDLHGPLRQATGFGILLYVPPALLRQGENVLHARMNGSSTMSPPAGLGRLTFGDVRAVRTVSSRDFNLTSMAYRMFAAAMLTAGFIALFLWFAQRGDRVMLWFAITCLSWAVAHGINLYLRDGQVPEWIVQVAQRYSNFGLPVPAAILCLRTVGLRWPRSEAVLWLHLLFLLTFPFWLSSPHLAWAWSYAHISGPLVCFGGAVLVLLCAPRPVRWSHWVEVLALLAMTAAFSFDLLRAVGWIELDSHLFRPYHVPALLLAFGAAIFDRHVAAFWRIARSNEELERRVAEKTREIEANHLRVAEAEREQVLALERQRIVTDMHDGLGASLIGLLRHVQSGGADRASIEQRVKEALQEMRIAIDALQPREGDLAAVLGSLRYRLDDTIRATGVDLVWAVEELPAVEELKPSVVFSLQRILLEAIANALKHSGARRVSFNARAIRAAGIEIRVEDDGRGFDPAQPAAGLGVANMRARADKIGANLEIDSVPGKGTVVRLRMQLQQAADRAPAKPEPQKVEKLVGAPGVA